MRPMNRLRLPALPTCLTLALSLGALPAAAQQAPGGAPERLGVNLTDVLDYSTEWVFVDVFKHARPWVPQTTAWDSPWDTGQPLATTPAGWPLLAPGQAAATLMLFDIDGKYPAGVYTCLYEGTGDLVFGGNASVLTKQPGKIELNVTQGNGGIFLKLIASDTADPVRNIRVIMPGFLDSYQSEPFHPLFVERLKPYGLLRFMRWLRINDSTLSTWAQRPTPNTFSQATDKGVALEYVVALANQTQKHAWVNVPHLATDDFVARMALLLRDNLDPDLDIYLEFSNEVWNAIYSQGVHAQLEGLIAGYSNDPWIAQNNWGSKRAVEIFEIFDQVFGAQKTRLVKVLGGMAAFTGPSIWTLDFQNAYQKADALAIAPYFGGELGSPSQAAQTLTKTVAQILDTCEQDVNTTVSGWITQNKVVADARGLRLIASEGGQRMVAEGPFTGNQILNQKFTAANRDARMGDIYSAYLDRWAALSGGDLMTAYVSCREYNQWGYYGILEHQDIALSQAPKYQALSKWSQAATGVSHFGKGCGSLDIAPLGQAKLGNAAFGLQLSGALPNTPVFAILGFSDSAWTFLALPLDLSVLFAPTCSLYAAVDTLYAGVSDGGGRATQALPIPANPNLAGLDAFTQWAAVNPAQNVLGIEFSQGMRLDLLP
jgi:hypothetical protein